MQRIYAQYEPIFLRPAGKTPRNVVFVFENTEMLIHLPSTLEVKGILWLLTKSQMKITFLVAYLRYDIE
ncbi:MAG: hypothetical protein ACP5O2_10805 [Bacteroidales bacterium]